MHDGIKKERKKPETADTTSDRSSNKTLNWPVQHTHTCTFAHTHTHINMQRIQCLLCWGRWANSTHKAQSLSKPQHHWHNDCGEVRVDLFRISLWVHTLKSVFSSFKKTWHILNWTRQEADRGVVLPFSQMYAVFILWPVPAENCIFFKKNRSFFFVFLSYSIWTTQIFAVRLACTVYRPRKRGGRKTWHFYLRCNSQWIILSVLRGSSKAQLNKVSRKTYWSAASKQIVQSPEPVSSRIEWTD